MESGLDGRNNLTPVVGDDARWVYVSMESGLDGRNNCKGLGMAGHDVMVSMESGLDGRNNLA